MRGEISNSRRWVAATKNQFFYIFDVTNPALPVIAWDENAGNTVITGTWANSIQFSADEQYLFVMVEANDIYVYDFRNPYSLVFLYKKTPNSYSIAHPSVTVGNFLVTGYTTSAVLQFMTRDYNLEVVCVLPFSYARRGNTNKLQNRLLFITNNAASVTPVRIVRCIGDEGVAASREFGNFCKCPWGYKDNYAISKTCIADTTMTYYGRLYSSSSSCIGSTGQPSSRQTSNFCKCPDGFK